MDGKVNRGISAIIPRIFVRNILRALMRAFVRRTLGYFTFSLGAMIYLGPGGAQLALDPVGVGLLLCVMVFAGMATYQIFRRRVAPALTLVAITMFLTAMLLQQSVMVPARLWPIILAAYEEPSGDLKIRRARDLQAHWHLGEMRATDWIFLSEDWGICHGLWKEAQCRMPSGPYEAEGIARELLEEIATRRSGHG